MAGVIRNPSSIALSQHGLRILFQRPITRPVLLVPAPSRASSFIARTRDFRASRQIFLLREGSKWRECKSIGFSTSAVRRVEEPKDQKEPSDGKPHLTPTTLRKTLSSKLTSSRENIYNVPNILTFSRLVATPVIGYLIVTDQPTYAFMLFAYAGLSDLVDGWIARKWKLQTVVGSVVDPMADKALMTTLVGCLAVNGGLPLPLATLILGRDMSLAIAALYYRYASLPAPKTMVRYWDFSLPSAEVHPTTISKLNTFLQLGLIGATMCVGLMTDPSLVASTADTVAGSASSTMVGLVDSAREALGGTESVQMGMKYFQGLVAATTVYSGLSYVWTRDAVKILGPDEALKKKQGFRGRMIVGGSFGVFIVGAGLLAWRDWKQKEDEEGEKK
ncbi:hypothetical protein GQ43DRAFT_436724 [Delitschia confertaspora ATCC 74209]|uniref:CDP-alcohol phosphatidyltransferase n=1 Tax=Delitschia confertaspora ATCC 74209 TaxID=1513339 RepID=A0A9P4N024_9PLEO|nr:hypothetical protein GQ43DRAFT_436724 [Delitschia confertaspora ATCC 74209]